MTMCASTVSVWLVVLVVGLHGAYSRDIFDQLMESYDKRVPPNTDGTDVGTEDLIGFYVHHLDLDTSTGMMFLDVYMRQSWTDPRLAFSSEGRTSMRLMDGWNYVWVPDYFLRNAKSFTMVDRPTPQQLMKLKADGSIWYVHRVQWDTYCSGLKDVSITNREVNCTIMFESFGNTADTLYFDWLGSAVDVNPSASVSGFTLTDTHLLDCTLNSTAGVFPCREVIFQFKKHLIGKRSVRSVQTFPRDTDYPNRVTTWNEHTYVDNTHVVKKRSAERLHPMYSEDDDFYAHVDKMMK